MLSLAPGKKGISAVLRYVQDKSLRHQMGPVFLIKLREMGFQRAIGGVDTA